MRILGTGTHRDARLVQIVDLNSHDWIISRGIFKNAKKDWNSTNTSVTIAIKRLLIRQACTDIEKVTKLSEVNKS